MPTPHDYLKGGAGASPVYPLYPVSTCRSFFTTSSTFTQQSHRHTHKPIKPITMKKDNKPKVELEPRELSHLTKEPAVRNAKELTFDTLAKFEEYIKNETWDDEYDSLNLHLEYIPPFILNEIHDDEEKIKPQMNALNKKFRRHLHQHLTKHLLPEINKMSGIKYQFKEIDEGLVPQMNGIESIYTWHYEDSGNHGFNEEEYSARHHWKAVMDVHCDSNGPHVKVDFKCSPLDL